MKTPIICLLFANSLWCAGLAESHAADKPNVLFVISDDLSYNLSGQGHPEVKTPNLDAFAKSAVSFTKAYTQFPLCGPSRAAIMTGQYAFKNGVGGNGANVAKDRVTLPFHFQNHGYWSARVSKIYHMGIPVDILQGTNGGDHEASWNERYNTPAMESMMPGKIVDYLNPDDPKVFPKEREVWKKAYAEGKPYKMIKQARSQFTVNEVADEDTTLMADTMAADKAIELLEQRAEDKKPFFLAVGFVRPHFPFIATESTIAPYDADEIEYPAFPENDFDDMPPQAINAKMEFSEEAIHVPLMISVPGMEGGTHCDEFVELIDLYPTLSELAGLPAEPGCQGLSLTGLMNDPASKRAEKPDALIQVGNGQGLRSGKWAYMYYPAQKKNPEASMLFDMENDRKQFNNLAINPEYAEKVKELHRRLMERIEDATQL